MFWYYLPEVELGSARSSSLMQEAQEIEEAVLDRKVLLVTLMTGDESSAVTCPIRSCTDRYSVRPYTG